MNKVFGYFIIASAVLLSAVAEFYSVTGLTSIFVGVFWPIVILGGSLGISKLNATIWLHKYWGRAEFQYKIYLSLAVVVLMLLTSMGIFGYLSAAHLEQSVPNGDIAAKLQLVDDNIKTAQNNIESSKKTLSQMDSAVDQTLARSNDVVGAQKSVNLRRAQQTERKQIAQDITDEQVTIAKLQTERAPIAASDRKSSADLGPLRYIAAIIYGDNPDANVMDKAVRWVIILIVCVFDPMALCLLLAGTKAVEWAKEDDIAALKAVDKSEAVLDVPHDVPHDVPVVYANSFPISDYPLPFAVEPIVEPSVERSVERSEPVISEPEPIVSRKVLNKEEIANLENDILANLPADLFGDLKGLPALQPTPEPTPEPVPPIGFVRAVADNAPPTQAATNFGNDFPKNAQKNDIFIRTDSLPNVQYKFNGIKWIAVDNQTESAYSYDEAYVKHLISEIESGKYDVASLSEIEQEQITTFLKEPK